MSSSPKDSVGIDQEINSPRLVDNGRTILSATVADVAGKDIAFWFSKSQVWSKNVDTFRTKFMSKQVRIEIGCWLINSDSSKILLLSEKGRYVVLETSSLKSVEQGKLDNFLDFAYDDIYMCEQTNVRWLDNKNFWVGISNGDEIEYTYYGFGSTRNTKERKFSCPATSEVCGSVSPTNKYVVIEANKQIFVSNLYDSKNLKLIIGIESEFVKNKWLSANLLALTYKDKKAILTSSIWRINNFEVSEVWSQRDIYIESYHKQREIVVGRNAKNTKESILFDLNRKVEVFRWSNSDEDLMCCSGSKWCGSGSVYAGYTDNVLSIVEGFRSREYTVARINMKTIIGFDTDGLLGISPDNTLLNTPFQIVDLKTKRIVSPLKYVNEEELPTKIQWNKDSSALLVLFSDTLYIWNRNNGAMRQIITPKVKSRPVLDIPLQATWGQKANSMFFTDAFGVLWQFDLYSLKVSEIGPPRGSIGP